MADVRRGLEFLLEFQLGRLERQQRLLHADGGEEDEVLGALLPRDVEDVLGGLVVDVPAVLDAAGARREARDDDVVVGVEGAGSMESTEPTDPNLTDASGNIDLAPDASVLPPMPDFSRTNAVTS